MTPKELHASALKATAQFQKAEVELLNILDRIDREKAYLPLGYSSLFDYVVRGLKLSEAQACNFINVCRKAREVPALKREIESGSLSVTKARKVVPVLTEENHKEWIEKAVQLPQRELEKEVARAISDAKPREIVKRVSEDRSRFQLGISDEGLQKLRRAQTLLSQRDGKVLSLEETIEALSEFYLKQKDPVAKAKRIVEKRSQPQTKLSASVARKTSAAPNKKVGGRTPIPASIKHQVALRDGGQCTFTTIEGARCASSSFVQIHHVMPVAKGGQNTLQNLKTLCASHHRDHHRIYS